MITEGVQYFAGKRVLLLQGPVGPFFWRLARSLKSVGALVHKVNFNAGDWLFYPTGAVSFREDMTDWSSWLQQRLSEWDIDIVLLFGDCRPVHIVAKRLAAKLGVEVGVFEEGYVRPNYVTLERFGVNGFSRLSRAPADYVATKAVKHSSRQVGNTYWPMAIYGALYFFVGALGRPLFPRYLHHRPMNFQEAIPWFKSIWRKQWYKWSERQIIDKLVGTDSGKFYLVPLQVFNDSQVLVHSSFGCVYKFISEVVRSFGRSAPKSTLLVIKHHPMDRGYRDYGAYIKKLSVELGLTGRVIYIHDQHLPTLLDHCRGVVVINSTVGFSAVMHGAPTKTMGSAVYDVAGLTYQGTLDSFWRNSNCARPNAELLAKFKSVLIAKTQLNGSFYRPLAGKGSLGGLFVDR